MNSNRRAKNTSITRGALILISGTVLAQLVTLVVTPVLTRLYPPEAFGFFSLVLAASSLVAPAIGLRLESALLLPRDKETATALFFISLGSSLILAFVVVCLFEAVFSLGMLENMNELPGFAWWAAGVAFLTATFTLASQMALRPRMYGAVSQRTIYQSVGTAVGQLAMSFGSRSGFGLVTGYLFGRVVGVAPLLIASRREFTWFNPTLARKAIRAHWRFPLVFAPSAMLNSIGLVLPVLFVGTWFSVADAGQWGMADRILSIPLILVGAAVGQVVEAEFANRVRNEAGRLTSFFLRATAGLVGLAGLVAVAVFFLTPIVIPAYLGPGWETAADLMQVLVLGTAVRLVAGPVSKVLIVLQYAVWTLFLDTLRLVVISGALLVTVVRDLSITDAAFMIATCMAFVYAVTWIISLCAVRRYERGKMATPE